MTQVVVDTMTGCGTAAIDAAVPAPAALVCTTIRATARTRVHRTTIESQEGG
ncbi:MAG: hypothetical protein WKF57_15490 [Nakamurella sp.]